VNNPKSPAMKRANDDAFPIVLPSPLCYAARNLRGSHDRKRLGNVRLGHLAVDLAQRLSLHRIRRLVTDHQRPPSGTAAAAFAAWSDSWIADVKMMFLVIKDQVSRGS
jgi:hypothetical protein